MADQLPSEVFIPIKITIEVDGDGGGGDDPLEFNLPLNQVAAFLQWADYAHNFGV